MKTSTFPKGHGMKKAKKINLKKLKRSIEKKYGQSPLCDFLLSYLDSENNGIYKIIYPDFYDDISAAVDPEQTVDTIALTKKLSRDDYSYSELKYFHQYATISAISSLDLPIPSEELLTLTTDFLKKLGTTCASELYLSLSKAENTLKSSPYFKDCDEATQNAIRQKVVKTSRKLGITENEAATLFLTKDPFEREDIFGAKLYFPILSLITSFLIVTSAVVCRSIPICFFLTLPLYICAKGLSDYIFSLFVKPIPIPKKKLKEIPDNARTLTVITALITGSEKDVELAYKIRNCAFANKDKNAFFGILCDHKEALNSKTPSDSASEKRLADAVRELNKKYGLNIFLFVRQRKYALSEEKYMGWERKRGAIIELTRYLNDEGSSIYVLEGDESKLNNVSYVVTLDSDTSLYTGAVKDMLGAMVHPSNTPIVKDGRVVKGHAILQPRMEPSLSSAEKTPFAILSAGNGGSDIYSTASYETYQSVFGEGIFCGKGIFDLKVFKELIDGTFPDGTVLSHDMLEGSYLRAGALTDVSLTDDLPKSPLSCFERSHRWLRGDVQNLAFIGKYHLTAENEYKVNPLNSLSKYKILDNVLRGIGPIFSVCALILCIFRPPHISPLVSLFALSYLIVPFLLTSLTALRFGKSRFFSYLIPEIIGAFGNLIYAISSLLHTALNNLDAIIRACYRTLFSGKRMLSWKTSSDSDREMKGIALYLYKMLPSFLSGIVITVFCPTLFIKLLGVLFALFPFGAYLIGKERKSSYKISEDKKKIVSDYGSDIWHFFSENVKASDNYLPPDNVQYSPEIKTAHRTSPTNIGLYLLSCYASYKLGYIKKNDALSRISTTVSTVEQLPSWNGHLYNWYDTEKLFILGSPYVSTVDSGNFITSLVALKSAIESEEIPKFCSELPNRLDNLINRADFSVLYDEKRKLFNIGINVENEKRDGFYDFYASEARTTSFFAIASGQIPREHWAALRRPLIKSDGYLGICSWTGTMFEYLMPSLLLEYKPMSLGYEALFFAVREQKKDRSHGIWGRSESGYFHFDSDMNYQYKAFGVASIGMKRGLEKDNVISPYSSFLALSVSADSALSNLKKIISKGAYGPCGFYEAIDMTHERVGNGSAVIRSYMAHHLGMSLISCANLCLDNFFVNAFMSDPRVSSAQALLEEKVPIRAQIQKRKKQRDTIPPPTMPFFDRRESSKKSVDVAVIGENGTSAVAYGDMLRLSYHKSEVCVDPFVFGRIYRLRFLFSADGAVFDAMDGKMRSKFGDGVISWVLDKSKVSSVLSLSVLGSCSAFVFTFSAEGNFSSMCPMLCFQPSIAQSADRASHPTYSDLLLISEYSEADGALLYYRREKSGVEKCICVSFECGGKAEFTASRDILGANYVEKDIEKLIDQPFECKDGVLPNPYCIVKKSSDAKGRYNSNFIICAGNSRDEAIYNLKKARNTLKLVKNKNGAMSAGKHLRRSINERLCSVCTDGYFYQIVEIALKAVIAGDSVSTPDTTRSISDIWKYGISADHPIIAIRLDCDNVTPSVKSLITTFISLHKYLSLSSIKLDTVILYRDNGEYVNPHREAVKESLQKCGGSFFLNRTGGIFLLPDSEDSNIFMEIAVMSANIDPSFTPEKIHTNLRFSQQEVTPVRSASGESMSVSGLDVSEGTFSDNGFTLYKNKKPFSSPPHSYVYGKGHFGTLVTDFSLGYTWIGNCHERRITEYCPDNLLGLNGETLIANVKGRLYDLVACSHTVFFGKGGAKWDGCIEEIAYTVTVAIDPYLPCKIVNVTIDDSVSVEYRIKAVLGDVPRQNRKIRTEASEELTVFIPTLALEHCDEAFLYRRKNEGRFLFILGAHPKGSYKTREYILNKYRSEEDFWRCEGEYEKTISSLLPDVRFKSDDKHLDIIASYYLPYQTLVGRYFCRTGFYQSSGAYGFRDQLQDCLCIMLGSPATARTHILRAACHQYEEGDVMHWWHVIGGKNKGVRTRYSDDLLWLPYVVTKYLSFTDDRSILDIKLPYLTSPPLSESESDRYETAQKSGFKETLYSHCVRAIEKAIGLGPRGIPKMNGGDWNDGMNKVKGESVWLGFFLSQILRDFTAVAMLKNDLDGASRYRRMSAELLKNAEATFDGQKYSRAFFEDGSHIGDDGFVDILPQAFSLFAGADEERSKAALKTAYNILYDHENSVFALLNPPFSRPSDKDVGYISTYPKGIRENGGQYTHGIVWGIMAMAQSAMAEEAYIILSSINPARLTQTPEGAKKYMGEPYFLAADVSRNPDTVGRCGWSIYTGSSGWFFSTVFAVFYGIRIMGDCFSIIPALSSAFPSYRLSFTFSDTEYTITAAVGKETKYLLDGKSVNNLFYFDKNHHYLEITVEISEEME